MMDIGKVQQAIQEYFIDITDDLVDIAEDTYVLASILASDKLLKRGIQSSEIQALTTKRKPTDKLSSDDILELDELARENSSEFVDNYESELVNGGRTINVSEWGNRDENGVYSYNGYDSRFVPWYDQFKSGLQAELYPLLTSGKSKSDIKADIDDYFKDLDRYTDTVARTEVLNNHEKAIIQKYIDEGIEDFLWVCSSQQNSPCAEHCAQFCGKIYKKHELPNGGELIHVRCRCSKSPVVSQHNVKEWEDLPVAESSDYARDLRGEPRRAEQIIKDSNIKVDVEAYKSKQLKIKSNDELKAGEIIPKLTPREALPYKGINLPEGYTKYSSTNLDKLATDIKSIAKNNPEFDKALEQYTSGPYKKINKYARGEWKPSSKKVESKYSGIISELEKGLEEAPKYNGNVYRGVGFSTEKKFKDFINASQNDGLLRFDGFTSTSLERKVADNFVKMGDKPFRVSMEIKSSSGVYLDGASYYRKNQEEVLFKTKSTFAVKRIEVLSDNSAHVILEEI